MANAKTCERCQGNGEIVTDWDQYLHAHGSRIGDEAVAECLDCGGEGIIDQPPPPQPKEDVSDTPSAALEAPHE